MPSSIGQTISRSAIRKVGKRHIYRIESADILNFCDRVRTVWEKSRELSADVVGDRDPLGLLGMRRRDQ